MAEMIIGGTVLIGMIMLLRRLTLGKISMSMRYALWLVVAVRLIVPFGFGSSSFSIMNAVQGISRYYMEASGAGEIHKNRADGNGEDNRKDAGGIADTGKEANTVQDILADTNAGWQAIEADVSGMTAERTGAGSAEMKITPVPSTVDMQELQIPHRVAEGFSIDSHSAVVMIWIAGMIVVGGFALIRQMRFIAYLHRSREKAPTDCLPAVWAKRLTDHGMQVWLVQGLPGPCMIGKGIYISPKRYEAEESRLHILAHEYAHAVQGDTLWAALRSILCMVWWFHPLVWLAAYEAKQDSELACDERAVRLLGETQRFSYGRTLLGLMHVKHVRNGADGLVLTMDGSGRRIRQRISVLADMRKRSKMATGIVAAAVLLLCGCAYTGARTAQKEPADVTGNAGTGETAAQTEAQEQLDEIENNRTEAEQQEQKNADTEQTARAEAVTARRQESQALLIEMEEMQVKVELLQEQEEELARQKALVTAKQEAAEAEMEQAEVEALREHAEELAKKEKYTAAEKAQIQKQLEQIEAEWRQATAEEFEEMLESQSDAALATAAPVDITAYYDYLYNEGVFPLKDGTWYLIYSDQEYGIDLYGLYTDQYGCRGVKMMIDEDVNSLDLPWLPTALKPEIFMLEQTEDGLPRTFAFQMCLKNTDSSEIWKLYLVDRYDTGSIDLYAFETEDYQQQFRDRVSFRIDQQKEQAVLLEDGAAVGGIDISDYKNYTVEEAFWDGAAVSYRTGKGDENSLEFVTGIGLKLAETDEIQYGGLALITCPVQIGEWGERSFTLGSPTVETELINEMLQALELE